MRRRRGPDMATCAVVVWCCYVEKVTRGIEVEAGADKPGNQVEITACSGTGWLECCARQTGATRGDSEACYK